MNNYTFKMTITLGTQPPLQRMILYEFMKTVFVRDIKQGNVSGSDV